MKHVILVFLALLTGFSGFAQDSDKLLSGYITVKNILVSGDSKAATEAATALKKTVAAQASFAQQDQLLASLGKVASAGDIDQQRTAFSTVSAPMWALVKDSGKVNQPVYYQYCPMKKAYWLSYDPTIRNPYFGSAMLTCGKTIETKK